MKTSYYKYLLIPIITLIFSVAVYGQSNTNMGIAVTAKLMGSTELKVSGGEYKPDLKRGKQLNDRDWVRTNSDGYLALMFLDDKSLLKLRENSELEIQAVKSSTGLDKSILMSFGKVKAEISPQSSGEFTITTPTSVASVKGTIFWIIVTLEGDQIVGIEGTVIVTNKESGETVTVGVGQTATSSSDGTIVVAPTPEGGVPDDPGETDEGNQIRIRLENADGDSKELIINY
ncbi:MAG: FecR domain-containing protein [Candidatus Marinimicrobia bacterium]|nr:FecR domain-containing protein [Candidatus Neomarinimicrobiota bacterium]